VRRLLTGGLAVVAAVSVFGLLPDGSRAVPKPKTPKAPHLANACFALRSSATGRFVGVSGDGYRADQRTRSTAARFFWKPATLASLIPQDQDGRLLSVDADGSIGRAETASRAALWSVSFLSRGRTALFSVAARRHLGIARSGELALLSPQARDQVAPFMVSRAGGCSPFPEADAGARGRPFRGTDRKGNVRGFADMHLHITANQRAGGEVIYGEPYDIYGITRALGHDAEVHGPDGSEDVTGNLLRTGLPFGTHDVAGWPTFAGWPVHDTITHQQTYYVWLQRAWMAGERLVVAQTVEDQPICEIEPRRAHSCDETVAVRQQVKTLHGLQNYVDAQAGGTGKGWFRLVYNPGQARSAIEKGRLAVLVGIESSNLFGCSEQMGQPECTKRDVDRGIRSARRLGVRSVFPMHWTDNAFGGSALEGGAKGIFINLLEAFQTGHYFRTGPCPEPGQGEEMGSLSPVELSVLSSFFPAAAPLAQSPFPEYPAGRQCNANGLTPLGAYLIKRLMANHMLIEVDHMSEWAREAVLRIAKRRHYPLVSGHTGTGGAWTTRQLKLLYRLGGLAAATPDQAPALAAKIESFRQDRAKRGYFAVGLGTDTGGFADLPGPRPDAAQSPLAYPFRAFQGNVVFQRQRTGQRTFDLNSDGVAHYGLIADLLADVQQHGGTPALRSLFRSAEAYLRMWQLAYRR
jgi:microsomal dipeptidase-like Zn-dependent dipeptidase